MADQGKVLISMTVPASTGRGLFISSFGTVSATVKPMGVLYEPTGATETLGQVQICGMALVKAQVTIAKGAVLIPSSIGTADVGDSTNIHLAGALALGAGNPGELIDCKII